jgi:DNA-binding transcriptional LysR family regulator
MLANAGQVFLEDALRILEQVDHALLRMQHAQHGQLGRLDIGFANNAMATETFIPDVLAIYRQRFPEVLVRLSEMHPEEQLVALQNHQIQIGFVASFQNIPTEFDSEVLQRIPLCGLSPHITQEVSDIRMVLGLVAANLGVSLVPASAMPLRTQGIIYRPLADRVGDVTVEIALVWRRNGLSPVVQEFLAVAREVLSQQSKTMIRAEELLSPGKDARGEPHRYSQ